MLKILGKKALAYCPNNLNKYAFIIIELVKSNTII